MSSQLGAAAHVLVADADDDSRAILTIALESRGYGVVAAATANAALAALYEQSYDVVLLDLWRPGMDGERVVHAIRRAAPDVRTTVIGLTSWAIGTERDRIAAAGCDEVLVKPVTPESVLAAVSAAVQRQTRHTAEGGAR